MTLKLSAARLLFLCRSVVLKVELTATVMAERVNLDVRSNLFQSLRIIVVLDNLPTGCIKHQ